MMLIGDSQSAVLPMVHILPKSESAAPFQTIPYIYGAAVFKHGKMVGESSEKIMRGVVWIKNDIKTYTATFKIDGTDKQVSLNPVYAHIKLIPKIQGEKWIMTIKVKTEGVIVENGTTKNPMDADFFNLLEQSFEEAVKERIQLTVDEVQHQLKADIFNFATEFHRRYLKHWKQVKNHWDEEFPHVQVNIEVRAHIRRPGLINRPGGMPKDEENDK